MLQPFAAVLDNAQEQSKMVVALTIAMPSTQRHMATKIGSNSGDGETQHHIGLAQLSVPALGALL